ncbi:MAG: phosphatase PAP2 family protein [Mogibacterium sp.]|nr:phosphatase PAP2 family protein [Mogibacterium sp.]
MDGFTLIDGNILIGIQHTLNADWLTPIMKFITMFGESGVFWIALCLLMLLYPKTRRLGIICSLSLLLTFICCNLCLKPLVNRTRPWVTFEEVRAFLPPPGDASFPSGHSANSMGPAWAMFISTLPAKIRIRNEETGAVRVRREYDSVPCLGWRSAGADPHTIHKVSIALVVLSVLIGISRLYLGMHYPSDVICGLLLGMICATIVHYIIKKIEGSRGIIGGNGVRD